MKLKLKKAIVFFVTFLSLVAFQLEGGGLPVPPSGYAYGVPPAQTVTLCSATIVM